jgi:hypothetical protein
MRCTVRRETSLSAISSARQVLRITHPAANATSEPVIA